MSQAQLDSLIQRLRSRPLPSPPSYHDLRAFLWQVAESIYISPDVGVKEAAPGGVPALELVAPGADPARVMLYLHGGGFCAGSPRTHGELTARLSRATGMHVISLDYRLAPEHPFPAGLEDVLAAWRALAKEAAGPARMVIAGDSAGGGLAMSALLALRDAGGPLPAAAVLLSPWIDLEGTGESMRAQAGHDPAVTPELIHAARRAYLGERGDPHDPRVAPLLAGLAGLPPLLIQVGTREVLLDDSRRLTAKARADQVEVTLREFPGMIHVFQLFSPILDEGQEAIDEIGAWVRERVR